MSLRGGFIYVPPSQSGKKTTRRHLLTATVAFTCLPLTAAEPESTSLYNGKDLTGWVMKDGSPANATFWKSVDGVLTGENDPAKKGSMLYTKDNYLNFECEAEARWQGELDSGFMVRKPELQMQIGVSRGLKKDMTKSFYTGSYPEAGQVKEAAKLLKAGDWNQFQLVAQGDTVTVWINGTEASKFNDAKYAGAGPIGLQIHGGLAMKIGFRNLKIKALK